MESLEVVPSREFPGGGPVDRVPWRGSTEGCMEGSTGGWPQEGVSGGGRREGVP